MGHRGNILAELLNDHSGLEELFERIQHLPEGRRERMVLVEQIVVELRWHWVAERTYLHPAVREYLPGGARLANRQIADHVLVEQILASLENADATARDYDALVEALVAWIIAHVAAEEGNLFPMLADVCPPEKLDELGAQVRATRLAPIGAHYR